MAFVDWHVLSASRFLLVYSIPNTLVLLYFCFCQFVVVLMPVAVSFCLFLDVLLQLLGKVNASLVGQTEEHPEHVGHLVAQCSLSVVGSARVGRFP